MEPVAVGQLRAEHEGAVIGHVTAGVVGTRTCAITSG